MSSGFRYLEVSCTPPYLQLQPPLSIPDSYYLFLSPFENFRLPEVLPDDPPIVPPVVLLDVHLEVHLEVLTFSDHT